MNFKDLPVQKPELLKLYADLGEDRIREIVFKFYQEMEKDAMIGFFFFGRDLKTIADKQTEFLLRAMGARASYAGKSPADAHTDLPQIRRGQFDRRLVILADVLAKNGLTQQQIDVWVGFENAFRDAILG